MDSDLKPANNINLPDLKYLVHYYIRQVTVTYLMFTTLPIQTCTHFRILEFLFVRSQCLFYKP